MLNSNYFTFHRWRTFLRKFKFFVQNQLSIAYHTLQSLRVTIALIAANQDCCFYSFERGDQSGARIHDEIFASGFCYHNQRRYCGPLFIKADATDDTGRLRKLLNLPTAKKRSCSNILLHETLYRERLAEKFHYRLKIEELILQAFKVKLIWNPEILLNQNFLHKLRTQATLDIKTRLNSVVLHIRRGDVNSEQHPVRFTSVDYYINIIRELSELDPDLKFTVHSQSHGYTSQELNALGKIANVILDADICLSWEDMIKAEIFVMAKSSFSYVPALYCKGLVVYQSFWHGKLDGWLEFDKSSPIDILNVIKSKRSESEHEEFR